MSDRDPDAGGPAEDLFLRRADDALRSSSRAGLILVRPGAGGRPVPEEALGRASRELGACLREEDLAGRVARDELAILVPGAEDAGALRGVHGRVLDALEEAGAGEARETPAAGAFFPEHGGDARALLQRARRTLSRAEEEATGGALLLPPDEPATGDPGARNAAAGRPPAEAELRRAVESGELSVVYQPVIRLSDGQRVGAEALLRWSRADGTVLEGRHLVPVARRTGLIGTIDRRHLVRALDTLSGPAGEVGLEWVSVNVALSTLDDPDLPGEIEEMLDRSGVERDRLVLEIAAAEAQSEPARTGAAVSRIRDLGVRIALDDVGAGSVPLAAVRAGGLDFLKIDPALVRGLHVGPDRGRLVDGLADLGHRMGARIVAEGVESEDERRRLAEGPCDYVQGFYLSEPLPRSELT